MDVPDTLPDLQDLKRGDENAWTQAFHALWRFAYHAALNSPAGLTPEEAEDVASETLMALVESIQGIQTQEHLAGWLVVAGSRRAISLGRRKQAIKRPQIALNLEALADGGEEILNRRDQPDPLADLHAAELLTALRESLNGLDPLTRQLLTGHHLEGLTVQELSRKFIVSPANVALRMFRGVRRIRQGLKKSPDLLKELQAFLR